jgi:uncharacterized protein YndB with AHSA1/START domain
MLNAVLYLGAAVAVLVAVLLLYASTRPGAIHVERSIRIKAPAEMIFPYINDFHQWQAWTPYDKDSAMKKSYSGSESGPGAHYAWEGDKQVGQGEIMITRTTPPHRLEFDLHMIQPFEARNVATMSLDADGDATRVTWGLDAKHNLMMKVVALFMDLDKLIGKDFELGLSRLKVAAER